MKLTLDDILKASQGKLVNPDALASTGGASSVSANRIAPLGESRAGDLAFLFSKAFAGELPKCQASVLIVGPPFVQPIQKSGLPLWNRIPIIESPDPYLAMARLSERIALGYSTIAHLPEELPREAPAEIHPSAVVDPTAELGAGVVIGPNCVIEAGVKIGRGTLLYPGCVIGPGVEVGEDCVFFARVTLYEWTRIGSRVRLHAGVVLGSDGFGYSPIKSDQGITGHQKIYHMGRVVVGDDVEIGANSCADRGTFGDTRIDREAKLDNLVHIGHNSHVERGAIICGGTCLAGNAHVGKFAYVGGLSGITNHVHVGDGAQVGALALVTKDVPPGGTAVGNPQREYREHFKAHAMLSKLLSDRSAARRAEREKD